ncbi:hypothetical protein BB561_000242 [Smittium simulii]|uniref:CID domain-containing protein n=1 Tax=Smittium simulii TaxID=133385 RepID=A0A2T9YZS5_9FUNG|nr:hypothetical protein BB561_000242 [Smittium simulii]
MVQLWYKELLKAQSDKKLALLYLSNDVLQTSRKKGTEFHDAFLPVLPDSIKTIIRFVKELLIRDNPLVSYDVTRVLNVWQERGVFSDKSVQNFKTKAGLLLPIDNIKDCQNKLNNTFIKLNQNVQNSRVLTMADELHKSTNSSSAKKLGTSELDTIRSARSHLSDEEALRLELIRDLSVILGIQKSKLEACKKKGKEFDQLLSQDKVFDSAKKRKLLD